MKLTVFAEEVNCVYRRSQLSLSKKLTVFAEEVNLPFLLLHLYLFYLSEQVGSEDEIV